MNFAAPLLFLQIVSTFAAKQGDFGIFQACKTRSNSSLRLTCSYANCTGSPPYRCRISSQDPPFSVDECSYTAFHHAVLYANTTTRFNCTLTRKNRVENRTLTVDYSITKGKHRIPFCRGGACSVWSRPLTSLWALGILLWTLRQDS